MIGRNGQVLLGTWVPEEVAERFRAHARTTEGGASAELRRLVLSAVGDQTPPVPTGAAGHRVMVRFKEGERLALIEAARERRTTPANWLRSLALAHLSQQPQWNDAEVQALRDVFVELRRIGKDVSRIAQACTDSTIPGEQPSADTQTVRDAAESIRVEMLRVGHLFAGNLAYWRQPLRKTPSKLGRRGGKRQCRPAPE